MKFNEAMKALKDGSRVTRQEWIGSMYFELDGKSIKSYQPKLQAYHYDEEIMISNGWQVEGEEGSFYFYDIIPYLQKGKKAKFPDWKDKYISYDHSSKCLVLFEMLVFIYHPDFESFTAIDWVII